MRETKGMVTLIRSEKLRVQNTAISGEVFSIQDNIDAVVQMLEGHLENSRRFITNILLSTSLTKPTM